MNFKVPLILIGMSLSPSTFAQSTTDSVKCDYQHTSFNSSESVNATSTSEWSCANEERSLSANGLPDHEVGRFPNRQNPHAITEQSVSVTFSLHPTLTDNVTELGGPRGAQGYVLNGVKIDAGTAGSCDDSGQDCSLINRNGNWHIEALGHNSFDFGTDDNNAHVQPGGEYHYHGMPEGFIEARGGNSDSMMLIAWAADGFPIYARYGYSDANDSNSAIRPITGSYQLLGAALSSRPSANTYALGTFQEDWEYVEGSGDLDECNGRFGVTPEFPEGTYHYYATDTYPYFQRCVKGAFEVSATRDNAGPGNNEAANGRQRPDFEAAANKLGVSQSELMKALGAPPPDIEKAAAALGVSVDELTQALRPAQ